MKTLRSFGSVIVFLLVIASGPKDAKAQGIHFGFGSWETFVAIPSIVCAIDSVAASLVVGSLTGRTRCIPCVVWGYLSGGSALGAGVAAIGFGTGARDPTALYIVGPLAIAAGVSAIVTSVLHPLRTPRGSLQVQPTTMLDRRGSFAPGLAITMTLP